MTGFFPVSLAGVLLLTLLFHVPSAVRPHYEGDEIVFTFLAERLADDPLAYHLRGRLHGNAARRFVNDTWMPLYAATSPDPPRAAALGALQEADLLHGPFPAGDSYTYDPTIYDRPLFFHPPLYPYALALARSLFGAAGGAWLSILLHAAGVLLVALLGREWAGETAGILAAALMMIDPVSWLAGSRLWIDAAFETVGLAAILGVWRAARQGGVGPSFGAGLLLGAACLTKLTAALLAPAALAAMWVGPRRASRRELAAYAAGAAVPLAPWLALTRVLYGQWIPFIYPTAWLQENYPFVRQGVERPAHFYITGLLLVAPVCAYAAIGAWRARRERWAWIAMTWAGAIVAGFTLFGVARFGMQLRYIAPAMPALALLAASGMLAVGRRWAVPAIPLAAITFQSALWSAAQPAYADPVPYATSAVLNKVGIDLREIAPRLWWKE